MNEEAINSPINTQSILSLVFGILTLLSFCGGIFPVPLTGFVCFPSSLLFGTLALVFGTVSLNRIRKQNESGSPMAWTGIILSGFVFACLICMVITLASLFIFAPHIIPAPPYNMPNFQL